MQTPLFALLFLCSISTAAQDLQPIYAVKYFNFTSQQQPLKMAYRYEKAVNPNGKTVLLLHGKNFSGAYWTRTMGALLMKGYDVIAPDQVGFGMSSLPACYQYSFQQLAVNTHNLLDSLHINSAIILGHSMGGMLAVRYVLMYPQACSQLILEDPIGLEDWKLNVPYSSIDQEYKKELNMTSASLKKYMMENYFHDTWKSEYDTLLSQSSKNLGNPAFAWSMAETSDMIFTQPVCYEFNDIKMPTVLIIGKLDSTAIGKEKVSPAIAAKLGNYPELGKKTAHLIPQCKLVELERIGHIAHIENFDLFMQTISMILETGN